MREGGKGGKEGARTKNDWLKPAYPQYFMIRLLFAEVFSGKFREAGPKGTSHLNSLPLSLIEMSTQNRVNKVGLRDSAPVGFAFDELFVVVRDNELLVLSRECPTTYVAIERTAPAGAALHVIALLTKWLPIAKLIGSAPRAWDFMVWAEFYVRFLRSARGAFVSVLLLEFFPISVAQFFSGFALLAYVQTLQLVSVAFLLDRSKALFALQFPHTAKNVFIGRLSASCPKIIHGVTDIPFGQDWSRNAMLGRPKRSQDDGVVEFVRCTRRNKTCFSLSKPLLAPGLRFIRRGSRGENETLAGTRLTHFAVRL